ncbi:M20/M25/M40 family metallo-hydrolase [Sphingomonas sanxanigenens]|uniref:Carboxypeptidase Q n=1 Tax=Sphingomonas sanxanigenens DSM 19645 = NX02 TaxID=1123269 RepID=W0AAI9_9SPHN|nr:M20/M25/M40 family metallo-hydrolase [Sphingomonas sanxanigenens]AHE52685.1 hypothetical protein NX02_04715 [Sphingomonas sanxanigenens DSM 19645 = NX02]
MKQRAILPALALPLILAGQPARSAPADDPVATAATLRDKALAGDTVAWDLVEGLTTEVGPRMAGTEAEARARAWAVPRLKALGFSNVRIETCDMPVWTRGAERAAVTAPFPAKLAVTALGNSAATPAEGIEAEVVAFETLADLDAAPAGSLAGKIAFVSHAMTATQDGSSYGVFGAVRRRGPAVAAAKGAIAIVIRSVGTDHHRNPHAGGTVFPAGSTAIPAAALSIPDAENLQRILKRGKPVTMRLVLTPTFSATGQSGNVIAEVPGSDPAAGIITIGGHLDSWDLATGAIDDASGVAITTAAAKMVMAAGKPRRTIRVVWYGAEEVGGCGGPSYLAAHRDEKHVLTAESDFGADRVWAVKFTLPAAAAPLGDRIARALAPIGIGRNPAPATGGADIAPLVKAGVPVIDLEQDGTRYFDIHHTPDDTLDKVDPAQLRQNVAAWTTMLWLAANAPETLAAAPQK